MRILPFVFAAGVLLQGCCTRDGSFHARVREANAVTLGDALRAKGLAPVPVLVDHGDVAADDPSIMVVATSADGRGPPSAIVVVDAEGVVHVVRPKPKKTITEHHHTCGCPPGGGAPPPQVRWYVRLADGQKAGPPIDLEVEEWRAVELTYSEHGAACAVP